MYLPIINGQVGLSIRIEVLPPVLTFGIHKTHVNIEKSHLRIFTIIGFLAANHILPKHR